MTSTLSDESISRTVQSLLAKGHIDPAIDTAVLAYDLDFLKSRVEELKRAFPARALHAIAIKANPLTVILELLKSMGCGFEVASLPEFELARSLGTPTNRIVFDSPAKTVEELRAAIGAGCHINIDSFQELERIENILSGLRTRSDASFGLRINPQVGVGTIEATSVGGTYSKFGIPLLECEYEIAEAYLNRPWLTGVHLHIGSQGCPMDMLLRGCGIVYDFVTRVNNRLEGHGSSRRVRVFDIGGGLPVSYHRDGRAETLTRYAEDLSRTLPGLFSDAFTIITEFGRHVHANSGWVLSRVEYVKPSAKVKTAILHVGADLFLRKCYRPDDWHHDVTVLDKAGQLKSGYFENYNLAGPLCFAGDFVARDVALPEVEPGDYVVLRDAGAYTLSMWSRYNSRQMPLVLGYCDEGAEVTVVRRRESVEDVVAFWSPDGRARKST
jgi:diaminopimelate decarboxylase